MGAGVCVVCVVCVVVVGWLAALTVYDIRARRLPNFLTMPGAGAILAGAAVAGHGSTALAGATALTVAYLAVHLLSPTAMGAGDVKLAIGVGALTGAFGFEVWTLATLTAPLLTAGCAVVTLIRRTDATVPHGPSMCVASALAICVQ